MNLSKEMENKIKKFVKSININIQYGKHIDKKNKFIYFFYLFKKLNFV